MGVADDLVDVAVARPPVLEGAGAGAGQRLGRVLVAPRRSRAGSGSAPATLPSRSAPLPGAALFLEFVPAVGDATGRAERRRRRRATTSSRADRRRERCARETASSPAVDRSRSAAREAAWRRPTTTQTTRTMQEQLVCPGCLAVALSEPVLERVAAARGGDQDRARRRRRAAGSSELRQAVGGQREEDGDGDDRRGDAAAREGEEERSAPSPAAPRRPSARTSVVLAPVATWSSSGSADRDQRRQPVPVVERVGEPFAVAGRGTAPVCVGGREPGRVQAREQRDQRRRRRSRRDRGDDPARASRAAGEERQGEDAEVAERRGRGRRRSCSTLSVQVRLSAVQATKAASRPRATRRAGSAGAAAARRRRPPASRTHQTAIPTWSWTSGS